MDMEHMEKGETTPDSGMGLPDWVEATDNISEPCGFRFSGDLTGFGRCFTGIKRADTANERFGSAARQDAFSIEADVGC